MHDKKNFIICAEAERKQRSEAVLSAAQGVTESLNRNVFDQRRRLRPKHTLSQWLLHLTGKCLSLLLERGKMAVLHFKQLLSFCNPFLYTLHLSPSPSPTLALSLFACSFTPPHHYSTWRDSVGERVTRLLCYTNTHRAANGWIALWSAPFSHL